MGGGADSPSELNVAGFQGSKTLFLIRHGQAQHNVRGEADPEVYKSWEFFDASLTPTGWSQAVQLRQFLNASSHSPIQPQLVVTSPLVRAMQTAACAFGCLKQGACKEKEQRTDLPSLVEDSEEHEQQKAKKAKKGEREGVAEAETEESEQTSFSSGVEPAAKGGLVDHRTGIFPTHKDGKPLTHGEAAVSVVASALAAAAAPSAACVTAHSVPMHPTAAVVPELLFMTQEGAGEALEEAGAGAVGMEGCPAVIASELCRECMGVHPCDKRRLVSVCTKLFPGVDFSEVHDEYDMMWRPYTRESSESMLQRGQKFLDGLLSRPESIMAVVSHSAFLRHFVTLLGKGVESEKEREELQKRFVNCEMRCVVLSSLGGDLKVELKDSLCFQPTMKGT